MQKFIICRKKFAAALECEGKQKRAKNRSHKPRETPRIAVAWKQIEIPAIKFEEKRQRNQKKMMCDGPNCVSLPTEMKPQ